MFNNIYNKKRVFVTGHTGFKGAWLSLWLNQLGAKVYGFSDCVPTQPSFYELLDKSIFVGEFTGDIRNYNQLESAIKSVNPDIIFHLAAQPLVRRSYLEPVLTVETNVLGTVNILEVVRRLNLPATILIVTTDKCYENRNWIYGYRENDALGGNDVYSASKTCAELMVQSYRRSFFENNPKLGNIATARAGNVIGGGDYAQDRIVPDCVRALEKGEPVIVRNPQATRPWQHILDCLSGYLWLTSCLMFVPKTSPLVGAFNFGPPSSSNRTVIELVEEIFKTWKGSWVCKNENKELKEEPLLNLSAEKAAHLLKWSTIWDFSETVRQTMLWYKLRHFNREKQMLKFSIEQITNYSDFAKKQGAEWTKS